MKLSTLVLSNNTCLNCHNKTILYIDSDKDSYTIISKILAPYNLKVIHATKGTKAIDVFIKDPSVIAILTELELEGTNGFQIIEQVRKINAEIPVFMLTTLNQYENILECLNSGFTDIIIKPIDFYLFIITLLSYLKSSRHINKQDIDKQCIFNRIL